LDVEKENNRHCNKTKISTLDIGTIETGFPVFEGKSESLQALFSLMKNEGLYARYTLTRPESSCFYRATVHGEVDTALNTEELAGIWVISACFAVTGLLVSYFRPWEPIKMKQHRQKKKEDAEAKEAKTIADATVCSKADFVGPEYPSVPPVFEINCCGGGTFA